MLRIPTANDVPPPLMTTVRRMVTEEPVAEAGPQVLKKRRRGKKASSSESHSWEQQPRSSRSGRSENRQMRMMLIGGSVLVALIVAGVVSSMNSGNKLVVAPIATVAPQKEKTETAPAEAIRGDAALLMDAEPLAKKFLTAKSIDELLPLVRNPEVAEPRMRKFYPDGKVTAPGLSKFNPGGGASVLGNLLALQVTTGDLDIKPIAFIDTAQGLRVDWESWIGWSEMSWETFVKTKPTTAHVFRVTLSAVDYYNFAFKDEKKWKSYLMVSPDGEHSLYGYVEKGTIPAQKIRLSEDTEKLPLMLSLKYPEGATSDSQVEIERFITDGWVENREEK
jgi:hypothetical protein